MLDNENISDYTNNLLLGMTVVIPAMTMLWMFGDRIAKNLYPSPQPKNIKDLFSELDSKDQKAILMAVMAYHDYYGRDYTSYPENCSNINLKELTPSIMYAMEISNSLEEKGIFGIRTKHAVSVNNALSDFDNTAQITRAEASLEILAANILCKMQPPESVRQNKIVTLSNAQMYLYGRPCPEYKNMSYLIKLLEPTPRTTLKHSF